ncbi:MAG TPA: hypothetical protein VF393_04255 [archaeon]
MCEKILSVCRGLAPECDNPIIKRENFDIYVMEFILYFLSPTRKNTPSY